MTWSTHVGLGLPDKLALGPTSGAPTKSIRRKAECWLGMRKATVSWPLLTFAGKTPGLTGRIMVKGPGQKRSISSLANSGTSAA